VKEQIDIRGRPSQSVKREGERAEDGVVHTPLVEGSKDGLQPVFIHARKYRARFTAGSG